MHAMVLHAARTPLRFEELPDPQPGPREVRVKVEACAVCRTDLHVVDGELQNPKLPIIPGHEIVGIVDSLAAIASAFPGSAILAAIAATARRARRICAILPCSPATRAMVALPPMSSPTPISRSSSTASPIPWPPRLSSARA
jgi:propanol-preferring alcohol dehydrogenase